jgi:hypothetical protein
LGGDRGGDGGVSVPARDLAGAQFSQFDLQRDADIDRARASPDRDDPSGGCGGSGIADGAKVVLGNPRGEVRLHAKIFDGVRRGVLIAESIWPNFGLRGRARHQHAHRGRRDRAVWRRGVP